MQIKHVRMESVSLTLLKLLIFRCIVTVNVLKNTNVIRVQASVKKQAFE